MININIFLHFINEIDTNGLLNNYKFFLKNKKKLTDDFFRF